MYGIGVVDVLRGRIIAKDYILRFAVLVIDVEIRKARAVVYKGGIDPWRGYCIFLVDEVIGRP